MGPMRNYDFLGYKNLLPLRLHLCMCKYVCVYVLSTWRMLPVCSTWRTVAGRHKKVLLLILFRPLSYWRAEICVLEFWTHVYVLLLARSFGS